MESCVTDTGSDSGGGGAAAGRIRINTQGGSADILSGAILSPTGNLGQCSGTCSQGGIALY